MSFSKVDICNASLMKTGELNISSIEDDSKAARLCKQFYDLTLEVVLRLHPWNFATERAALASSTETPPFGWDYKYPLPPDCLRVLSINGKTKIYKVEGRNILTNESECNLIYVKRVTDTSQYDSLFVRAFSLKLAAEMAFNLTQERRIVESLETEFQRAVEEARAIDGMEDNYQPEELSDWINSRY